MSDNDNSLWQHISGYSAIVQGSIALVASVVTLIRIYRQESSFTFVRVLTWVILVSCLIQIADGAVMIKIINKDQFAEDHPDGVFTLIAVSIFAWDLSNFIIVWFVTFKYWETARQFARVMRLMEPEQQEKEKSESKVKFNEDEKVQN